MTVAGGEIKGINCYTFLIVYSHYSAGSE